MLLATWSRLSTGRVDRLEGVVRARFPLKQGRPNRVLELKQGLELNLGQTHSASASGSAMANLTICEIRDPKILQFLRFLELSSNTCSTCSTCNNCNTCLILCRPINFNNCKIRDLQILQFQQLLELNCNPGPLNVAIIGTEVQ